jgi:PAS domain S-box-containing protein
MKATVSLRGLRTRLLLLVLVAVVPFVVLSVHEHLRDRQAAIEAIESQATEATQNLALNVDRLLDDTRQYLDQVARHPALLEHDDAACSELFAVIATQDARFQAFELVEPDRAVRCAYPAEPTAPARLVDFATSDLAIRAGQSHLGTYRLHPGIAKPVVPLTIGVLSHHDDTPSRLAVGLSPEVFEGLLNVELMPENTAALVIDRNGVIVARVPEPEQWRGQFVGDLTRLARRFEAGVGITRLEGVDGVMRQYAFRSTGPGSRDLMVSVAIPADAAMRVINRHLARDLLLLLALALLAAMLLWFAGSRILLDPIRRLARAARAVRDGDYSVKLGFGAGEGEFAELAADFEAMAERLDQRTRAYEARGRELVERVKEATCLKSVLGACADRSLSERGLFERVAGLVPAGFLHPERTRAAIEYDDQRHGDAEVSDPGAVCLTEPIHLDAEVRGRLIVALLPSGDNNRHAFLPEERQLVRQIAEEVSRTLAFRRIETALQLLERGIGAVTEGVVIADIESEDQPIAYVNRAFSTITGYAPEEAIGRNCRFLQGEETETAATESIREAIRARQPVEVEILNYRKSGEPFWNALSLAPITDRDGRVTHYAGIQRDVTEDHRTRQRIDILAAAVDAAPSAVVVTDDQSTILYVNPGFQRLTGYSADEAIGQTPRLLRSGMHGKEFYEKLWGEIRAGRTWRGEIINRRRDGAIYTAIQTITPVHDPREDRVRFVAIQDDVTELRQAEQMLWQTQRMDAVGQLTGGIAHDFNNLLTVILGNLEGLEDLVPQGGEARHMVEMSRTAAERAAELTRRLLAFARRQPLEPRVFDIGEQVRNLHGMLLRVLGEEHEIRLMVDPDLPSVYADPAQIESVLLNLAINARDAMPDGGLLTIHLREAHIDSDYARMHDVTSGDYVSVAVSDTGTGMPADVLARAHEPFFTTKEPGKGTGLGLSMVHGFARQSGGHLRIYSEPGEGTTIRLYLPCHRGAVTKAEAPLAYAADELPGGSETVLVVEDEPLVRAYVLSQLQALGYRTLEASESAEALAILGGDETIDALFTDIILPGGVNGRELANRARELRPGLPVLFTSGYSEDVVTRNGTLEPGMTLLSKPYQRQELARRIRELLDGAA